MAPAIPDLGFELPEIDQIAIVVEDLKDGMDRYQGILGIEPWTIHRFEPPDLTDTTYRGEPTEYGMLLALAHTGDTMIELIQPTFGPNLYDDHLADHGEGLHHVAYFGWDEDETRRIVRAFEDAGMPVIQSGRYGSTEFWYFDTADILNGLIFETAVRRLDDRPAPLATYPDEPYEPEP